MALDAPFYVKLGNRVRELRKNKGMTQQDLGLRLQPAQTRAAIANIEGGKQRVLAHTLAQLAEALGVAIGEIAPSWFSVSHPEQVDLVAELSRNGAMSLDTARRIAERVGRRAGVP